MVVSYNRLWKLLINKKMSKLRRDEPVTMIVLDKICSTLDVDFGDVMEYIKAEKQ